MNPTKNVALGYIVPQWVKSRPTFADVYGVYEHHLHMQLLVLNSPIKVLYT
jgi:hypothetical protein